MAVSIQSITDLVVASFIQGAQIIPHFGNVWIQTNSPRVSVKCITVLGDLVVEHTNGAPEGWVSGVTVNSLLERLVGSVEVTTDHVDTAQVVPRMSVTRIDFNRLGEVLESDVEVLLERLLALSGL